MARTILLALGLSVSLAVSGCKIVKNPSKDDTTIAEDASGDDARTAIRIATTFDSQLLPYVREKAVEISALRIEISKGLDAAGEMFAKRGSGMGAAWNFPLRGTGLIVETKLDSRARWLGVDTDDDGTPDVRVQIGPVIKGNALRDAVPFYNFDDFRDQIEFAKLGRAINDEITGLITVPDGDLTGRTVRFTGVVPLKKAGDAYLITPIELTVLP